MVVVGHEKEKQEKASRRGQTREKRVNDLDLQTRGAETIFQLGNVPSVLFQSTGLRSRAAKEEMDEDRKGKDKDRAAAAAAAAETSRGTENLGPAVPRQLTFLLVQRGGHGRELLALPRHLRKVAVRGRTGKQSGRER